MPFTIAVHHGAPYLHVVVTGNVMLTDLLALADFIDALRAGGRYRRVVVNLLDAQHSLSFTDHLQLGAHIADRLNDLERFASVVPEAMRTGSSEKAAQKFGLRIRTFTQLQAAVDWVQEP